MRQHEIYEEHGGAVELENAVVIVTGGNGAMGPDIVHELENIGAIPVAWDVYIDGGPTRTVACDVADPASVETAMTTTREKWGLATGLINAAAISGGFSSLASRADGDDWNSVLSSPEVWLRVLGVNVVGVANCMRVFARELSKSGTSGSIVNISSIGAGPVAEPGLAAYAASKAAVNQLTRVAAADFGPLGIRVNALGAGVMEARMLGPVRSTEVSADARPTGFVKDITQYVPIEQRHGTGADVAQAACALLRLGWVTGQVFYADGGLTLRSPVTT